MAKLIDRISKKYSINKDRRYRVYYAGLLNIESDTNKYENNICFSLLLNEDNKYYKIQVKRIKDENINHFCFFDDHEIKKFLDTINIIFGSIDRYKINKKDIEIWIDFNQMRNKNKEKYVSKAQKLTIFSLIRYLFESPYSLLLKKAFIYKKELKNYSLLNLLMAAHVDETYGSGHCLMLDPLRKTPEFKHGRYYLTDTLNKIQKIKIKTFMNESGNSNNSLFKKMPEYNEKKHLELLTIIKKYDENTSCWE